MKIMYKIQKFMNGRYGPDELYSFFIRLYIFIFIIDVFIDYKILNILELFIVVVMFYRFFSKNITKRRKENKYYLKYKCLFLKPFKEMIKRYRERDKYVYKKCFKCKTILRLPLPSRCGIQHVKCPKCKKRISFLCFRKEKIEIIRNKK